MNTKKIVYCGVFIALGIIIPQIFHFIGGPALGGVFLPMHFPVLAAGLLGGPLVGLFTGILSPLLSSGITGMPPVPRLWFMILELGAYGMIAGFLYYKMRKNLMLSLIISMIAGRILYGAAFIILINFFGVDLPAGLGVTASLAKGIPGMVLQVIILPILIKTLERSSFKNDQVKNSQRSFK